MTDPNLLNKINDLKKTIVPKSHILHKIYAKNKDKKPTDDIEEGTEMSYIRELRQGLAYDYDKNNYILYMGRSKDDEMMISVVEYEFLESIKWDYKNYTNLGEFVVANQEFFLRSDQSQLYHEHARQGKLRK